MADRDRNKQEQEQAQVASKDAPPNGYAKTDRAAKGPHRSDPDFGRDVGMSNPVTVKKEPR